MDVLRIGGFARKPQRHGTIQLPLSCPPLGALPATSLYPPNLWSLTVRNGVLSTRGLSGSSTEAEINQDLRQNTAFGISNRFFFITVLPTHYGFPYLGKGQAAKYVHLEFYFLLVSRYHSKRPLQTDVQVPGSCPSLLPRGI